MTFFAELKRRNVFRVAIAYGIVSWLVVQVAEIATDSFEAPTWVIKTFITFLLLGFPFALIFAWAFELTPEGIKKEKDVDRTQSITHQTGHKLDRTIIAILVIALGYFAWDKFSAPGDGTMTEISDGTVIPANTSSRTPIREGTSIRPSEPQAKSLAVLPFVDMSQSKDNEYFTDGLTEELLNILAQIKSLQVAGRTSSFAFKDKTEDLRDIGKKLNVNTLLEGSVRKDDQSQRIRVTVQLINVEDGYHIWSDTYDRELKDIFAIQEDIARQVAEALKINLLGEEVESLTAQTRTGMSAYDLYLQGLQSLNLYSYEGLSEADRLLTESLTVDPDYLPTKLALAHVWIEQAQTGSIPAPEAFAKANPLLDEILQEDPANSDAHSYRGHILDYNREFAAARKSFERAVESNPRNANALTKYGGFLFGRGEVEEGLSFLRQASKIEPYDVAVQWQLCITQALLTDVAAATRECERIGEIQPGNPMQFYGRSYLYHYIGDLAQALYWQNKAMEADPADPELAAGGAFTWLDLGDMEQAEAWLQKAAMVDAEHPRTLAARIEVLQQKEQYQQALGLAQKAYDEELPGRHGSDYYIERLLVLDAVRQRQYDKALGILNKKLPDGLASPLTADDADDADVLASMAMVLKLQDPASEQVTALLDHADALNNSSNGRVVPFKKPFTKAMIESARGNKAAAISSLQESFDKGWRWDWRFIMNKDFQFEPLHLEPEFKRLIALMEEDMEKQREEAYELLGLTR